MKNFFKKLAFVMALAMVITSLAPAAGVFAASAPKLNAKSKTLLLGTKGRNYFDFNLANKVKGSTYKWTTSNKKVAAVAQNGYVKAVGNGTATIKLAIKLPTGKTTTLSATVTVKTNAKTVEITNLPEGAIKANVYHNFNRSYTTVAGKVSPKTTDVTKFVITSDNADKAKIYANGFFKATEAGEYTIQALMAQSNSKMAAGVYTAKSKEVKVVVEPSMVSVKQTASDKFVVTFDADMSKNVTKDNLVITDSNGVKQAIVKSVKFDDAGKVATVETYISLKDKEVYTVSYDKLSKEFVASIGAIAKVVITGPNLVADNEPKPIKVVYYDANGVDVTSTANGTLEFENVSGTGWIDGNKITLFNIGDKTVIKAKYHTGTYDENWNEVVVVSDEYLVTAVDNVGDTITGLTAWTIDDTQIGDDADYTKPVHSIPLNATNKFLNVKTVNSTNAPIYDGYKFATTDASKLIVDPTTGQLVPVSTGTVGVVVTNGTFKTVITVTVTPEAVASTPDVDKRTANISEVIEQSVKYNVSLKDQYGNDFSVTTGGYELLTRPNTTAVAPIVTDTVSGGKYQFEVKAVSGTTPGSYTYKLTVDNKRTVPVTVNVLTSTSTEVSSYRFAIESSSYDTVVSKDSKVNGEQTLNLSVLGYDDKGVAIKTVTPGSVKYTAVNTADSTKKIEFVNGVATITNKTTPGTYVVTGEYIDGTTTYRVVTTNFVVKNSQVKASVSRASSEKTANVGADLKSTLSQLFTATSNAKGTITKVEVNEISTTAKNVLEAGRFDVFVKTVSVTETFGGNSVTYDVTVNAPITLIVK